MDAVAARDEKGRVLPGHSTNPAGTSPEVPSPVRREFKAWCRAYVQAKNGDGLSRLERVLDALLKPDWEPVNPKDPASPVALANAGAMEKTLFGLLGYGYGLPTRPVSKAQDKDRDPLAGGITVHLAMPTPCRNPCCAPNGAKPATAEALEGRQEAIGATVTLPLPAPDRAGNGHGQR